MLYRKAAPADLAAVAQIYSDIHAQEEAGLVSIGRSRAVYPTAETAHAALARGNLFVQELAGAVTGAAIINQTQVEVYRNAAWHHPAPDGRIMVLHTLVISPAAGRRGLGRDFVAFYERYALEQGCPFLRMDTNARNLCARALYQSLGYTEVDILPCTFNGLPDVQLVLLEKKLP